MICGYNFRHLIPLILNPSPVGEGLCTSLTYPTTESSLSPPGIFCQPNTTQHNTGPRDRGDYFVISPSFSAKSLKIMEIALMLFHLGVMTTEIELINFHLGVTITEIAPTTMEITV